MLKRFQLSKALLTQQSIIHIASQGEPYKMGLTIADAIGCTKTILQSSDCQLLDSWYKTCLYNKRILVSAYFCFHGKDQEWSAFLLFLSKLKFSLSRKMSSFFSKMCRMNNVLHKKTRIIFLSIAKLSCHVNIMVKTAYSDFFNLDFYNLVWQNISRC